MPVSEPPSLTYTPINRRTPPKEYYKVLVLAGDVEIDLVMGGNSTVLADFVHGGGMVRCSGLY
jgi:hypothetical protein